MVGGKTLYERLAAPFEKVYTREQAGQVFRYITGEQCISRLNEACGLHGWSFRVAEHGRDDEADEVWALVELTVLDEGGLSTTTYGFGSQKIKRKVKTAYNRETNRREQVLDHNGKPIIEVLNLGQDMKGAMTDALKVAAKHVGVALYLYDKDEAGEGDGGYQGGQVNNGGGSNGQQNGSYAPRPNTPQYSQGDLVCADCGDEIVGGAFNDGKPFTAQQAAGWGLKKHGRALCSRHYREANAGQRRAEEALQAVPF